MDKSIVSYKSKKRKHELGTLIKVNGRTIGQVYNGVLEKDVSRKKHFLHYPEEAIAFTLDALHAAIRAGAEYVDVLDTDNGIHYRTAISNYFEHGEKFNYNWGEQIKLTLPNFLQTVDPEFTNHADATAQEYTDPTDTHSVKPLHYRSHAPKGVTFTPGVKQLDLFRGR